MFPSRNLILDCFQEKLRLPNSMVLIWPWSKIALEALSRNKEALPKNRQKAAK